MCSKRRMLILWGGLAGALLVGCGAGDSSFVNDFFGGGSSPGSAFTQVESGGFEGIVAQRSTDKRILILGSLAELAKLDPPITEAQITRIAGAVIVLDFNDDGKFDASDVSQTTGADGVYNFTNIPAGDYKVRFTLPATLGGSPAIFNLRINPGETVKGLPGFGAL